MLIAQAGALISQARESEATGWVTTPSEEYAGWRAQALSALRSIVGKENVYYQEFESEVTSRDVDNVRRGRGILTALHSDMANGYMRSYRDLVTADVFANFLDSAAHLLEHGYRNAAASITGAVLENGLRGILGKHAGQPVAGGNLQSLSQQLFQKKIVSGLEQKNLQAWIALRDHADHGEFDAYDSGDVRRMIDGVTAFLAKH
jgi:hypothetical protein